MNAVFEAQLEKYVERLEDLERLLASPDIMADMQAFKALSKEHSDIQPITTRFARYTMLAQDMATAQDLLDTTDAQTRQWALEEMQAAQQERATLANELKILLLPKDPDDARNAFLEIRAGTGGDESAIFVGDMYRMYLRYCESRSWRVEVMNESPSESGGFKEVVLRIEGENVYRHLKFESGGHRVQRVPLTETQGRIHTSACTVAVMPEPDAAQALILNPADLRIDTFRASGAGGQHINKTDSAVRVVHIPTGIVAECQDARSQHSNKARALQVLQARIQEKERSERAAKEAALRKGLIGSGDRSDRIRTYNYPQGRLTDHRINLTLYKLGAVMQGQLHEVVDALVHAREAQLLAELEVAAN